MYMAFPLLPMRLATTFRGIYQFLLNKWYFDELYDAIFVQPLIRLARVFWQTGDAMLIDGVPNGLAELTVDGSRQAVKIQTGSLAMYAFVMLIGVVVLVGSSFGVAMNAAGFPILSLITWLPLVGGLIIMSVRGDEETVASNARWTALWTSLIVLVLSRRAVGEVRPGRAGLPVRRGTSRGCRNTASATRWAWTASRCCSCCSPPC